MICYIASLSIVTNIKDLGTRTIDKYLVVIYPDSRFKIIWEGIFLITLVINLIFVPFKTCFLLYDDHATSIYQFVFLEIISGIILIFDVILNF